MKCGACPKYVHRWCTVYARHTCESADACKWSNDNFNKPQDGEKGKTDK